MKTTSIFIMALLAVFTLRAAEQEVSLRRDFGTLYGTLRTPNGGGDAVAIFIAGSGPTDRNCNSTAGLYTNSFVYLAQVLEEQGIASLRYDKRGIAASRYDDPQKMFDISFDDYIADAAAWAEWLREQGFKKIVFIGHSEGSLIALCAAADKVTADRGNPEAAENALEKNTQDNAGMTDTDPVSAPGLVNGLISLAGAGFPIDEIIITQLSAQLSATNPGLLIQAISVFNSLRQGRTVEKYPKELEMLFLPYLQRYWISLMKYNPQDVIRKIDIPILIVNGDNDIQISVTNAESLKKARPEAEYLIIEGMAHPLKQCKGRDAQEQMSIYMDASIPLDPTLAEAVPRFIRAL